MCQVRSPAEWMLQGRAKADSEERGGAHHSQEGEIQLQNVQSSRMLHHLRVLRLLLFASRQGRFGLLTFTCLFWQTRSSRWPEIVFTISICIQQIKGRKDVVSGSAKAQKEEGAVIMRIRNLDRFQICLAACRTSSASVRHENTYKDPFAKHCYAIQPSNSHQRHRRDIVNSLNNNGDSPAVVVTSSSVMMFLTRLSTECHSSYRPALNESSVLTLF